MRTRLGVALVALTLLIIPASAAAQDPTEPPSLCGSQAERNLGVATIDGETPDAGQCAIAVGSFAPAWTWLDASITVTCSAGSGTGTSAIKDGWYLYGTTRNAQGAIVGQGVVGPNWTGCTGSPTRTYHLQLVMQGEQRSIALIVERRRWPFSGSNIIGTEDMTRGYAGTAEVHGTP